jgi:predicted ArsR family transcriptional regulator
MKQLSLFAFEDVRQALMPRQQEVLNAMASMGGKATMHDVAEYLHVPLHAISGRFSELSQKHIIAVVGRVQVGTSHRSLYSMQGEIA